MKPVLSSLEWFSHRSPKGDIGLACGVLLLLSILIVPMPTVLLDLGLAASFMTAVLTLMVAMFLQRPLDFSSFPSLLLLTTLLRLSLNVATARLILAHGNEGPLAAGHVVAAFGGFLMGGDIAIGGVVFIMLLIVNFIVITKGSSRIAEVSARFSLDAMPGKQMAIDADLSSGVIDEATAGIRRSELEAESNFYGAMDGAAKFVRGDAIAALIITVINIVGGLIIGLVKSGMTVADSIATFTTLTIGDGLASQVPSLLVSTAAGIVVSKGSTDGGMSNVLFRQMAIKPKPLGVTAGAGAVLALMPGIPALPFLAVAGLAAGGAWLRARRIDVQATTPESQRPPEDASHAISTIDNVRVELGYGLLSLAGEDGSKLPEQIRSLRRAVASDLGFVLPAIRIQDNLDLGPNEYQLFIKDIAAGKGELRPIMLLAIDTTGKASDLAGEPTIDPTFGLPARWIEPALREQAVARNCTVVDPTSVLTTHLTELLKDNISELLSYAETQKLLSQQPMDQQKLVSDLVPNSISVGGLQRVLQALLAESVSIRDLPAILEAVQEACSLSSKGVVSVVAHVRSRLARQISDRHTGPSGFIPIISVSANWEDAFAEALVGPSDDRQLALPQTKLHEFIDRVRAVVDTAMETGEAPVLLTSVNIRFHVHAVVERIRPGIPVLAHTEIHRRSRIKVVGTI
ncbi:MAG: flagellar biosynthesis protein FlhA [Proteobacteria bacterium]|nr:flagellar biosynthesis protein FlhA [Pseudomonadota bacterium]